MLPRQSRRVVAGDTPAHLLILTALLSGALIWLLGWGPRYAPPAHERALAREGEVILVDMRSPPPAFLSEAEREAHYDLVRSLRAWVDLLDPTTLLLPNESLGFSQVRRGDLTRPFESLPPLQGSFPMTPLAIFAATPLTPPPPALEPALEQAWLRTPPLLPAAPAEAPPDPGAYWRDVEGVALPPLPALALAAALLDRPPPTLHGPTRLRCLPLPSEQPGGPPAARVTLLRGSGDPALDTLAINHLRRHLAGLAARAALAPEQLTWFTSERTIEVFWHRLPGGLQAPPPRDEAALDSDSPFGLHGHPPWPPKAAAPAPAPPAPATPPVAPPAPPPASLPAGDAPAP